MAHASPVLARRTAAARDGGGAARSCIGIARCAGARAAMLDRDGNA